MAAYLWGLGDEAGTIAAIDEAVRLIPVEPPSRARAAILASQAQFLMLAGRLQDAVAACQSALVASHAAHATTDEVSARITLGTALGHLGQLDIAIEHLEQAHAVAAAIGDGEALGRSGVDLAIVLAFAGRREREDEVYRSTSSNWRNLGSNGVRAATCC